MLARAAAASRPVVVSPWAYYAKLAVVCFTIGGCMEAFMISTGFYSKVTEIEAARLEESREEREAFLRRLHAELERQAAEKGVKLRLPPPPPGGGGGGGSASGGSEAAKPQG